MVELDNGEDLDYIPEKEFQVITSRRRNKKSLNLPTILDLSLVTQNCPYEEPLLKY